jgi:dihydroflavonol-4-reductase
MNETVLVTGITGFIAKQVAADLLKAGHRVRGTLRAPARADEVRRAVAAAGADPANLSFVEADLERDAGWAEAMRDCACVQHIASPFPKIQPKDREGLVPAARDGAVRVVDAALAGGVRRIVLTSSMAAMIYTPTRRGGPAVTESDWTDPDWPAVSAYAISKTRAERAAWQRMRAAGRASDLVVVNPAMVLGPVLDGDLSTSSEVVRQMLLGAVPVLPPVHYAMVDVRDLSALQVAAMDAPEAGGRRLIASHEQPVTFGEIAGMLREALGAQAAGAPRRTLPLWLAKLFAKFDPKLGLVVADLALTEAFRRDGALLRIDSSYVTRLTGVRFRSPRESVLDCARSLLAAGAAGNRGAR